MNLQQSKDEYTQALRAGHREYKDLSAAGKSPFPAVLDELLADQPEQSVLDVGLVEIPADQIIGTKSPGRIAAFTAGFMPLLSPGSEFAAKWVSLCDAHLGDTGIRDPISCFEYLGRFYVEEGHKRVSVLKHFGAPRIPGMVRRIVPPMSDEPRIRAYYEFLDFYKVSRLYTVQFRRPGDYAALLAFLGKEPGEVWSEAERRTFNAYFHYFRDAFSACRGDLTDILPEEALLLWLKIHSYKDLGLMSTKELRDSLAVLWPDVLTSVQQSEVTLETQPMDDSRGILARILPTGPAHLNIAFIHLTNPAASGWVQGHEDGKKYVEELFGNRITARSYFDANTPEEAERLLELAVADGAQVVFTTAPKLCRVTLKIAVQYPRVHFFNCSVDQPYSSLQTYYGRIFEAKFISGAIAGAMSPNRKIGYIGSNPIFGVPASINAFALGAQMVNPDVEVHLRWSCCGGNPQADFFRDGIRLISNRDVPTQDRMYMSFCNYGTYLMEENGGLVPLASPVWLWGKFYEYVIRAILNGAWKEDRQSPRAINYWLGMDSGVIGISLGDGLPEGVRMLAHLLQDNICTQSLDPFFRKITAQDGRIMNDGQHHFSPEELLRMDFLVDNVVGSIPEFDDLLPMSRSIVRELGLYRDQIPVEKENIP